MGKKSGAQKTSEIRGEKNVAALFSKAAKDWTSLTIGQSTPLFESLVRLEVGTKCLIIGNLPDLVKRVPSLKGDEELLGAILESVYDVGYKEARGRWLAEHSETELDADELPKK